MTEPHHICPPDHTHGETSTCYTGHKCKCPDCRESNRDRSFYRRHMLAAGRDDVFDRIVDARGVRRRLQALQAIGWSARRLGSRLGITADAVLLMMHRDRVLFSTHERICRLYDAMSDTPAPQDTRGNRHSASVARGRAARNRWARPIDWDDIDLDDAPPAADNPEDLIDVVAVQLVIEGTPSRLTRQERHLAVTQLNARGYNDQEICKLLLVSDKTIERDREYLGLPANDKSERKGQTAA